MFASTVSKACTDISFASHVSPPQPRILPPAQWSPLNTFRDPGSQQRCRWREEKNKKVGGAVKKELWKDVVKMYIYTNIEILHQGKSTEEYTPKFPCACMQSFSRVWLFVPHEPVPTRFLYSWNLSDNNTGVGYHFLLQGIYSIQVSNPRLLHGQADFFTTVCHLGSLKHLQ